MLLENISISISPMTRNIISILDDSGIVKIKRNNPSLSKVFKEFFELNDLGLLKVFKSSDDEELLIMPLNKKIERTFLI